MAPRKINGALPRCCPPLDDFLNTPMDVTESGAHPEKKFRGGHSCRGRHYRPKRAACHFPRAAFTFWGWHYTSGGRHFTFWGRHDDRRGRHATFRGSHSSLLPEISDFLNQRDGMLTCSSEENGAYLWLLLEILGYIHPRLRSNQNTLTYTSNRSSSVNRLFTHSAAPVLSLFSALALPLSCHFLLLLKFPFIEWRKFALNNDVCTKGNLRGRAWWRTVKFWCSGWYKDT